ncbi:MULTISPECIES: helix-turn-helix domain-containing protein [Gordonibacter]|uniref:Helix-turn-helix transcriptional regulator n=1 Tax=Gordonibacter faecis TaxID=3047475 RepID=A0ABT7DKN9_9ACTN|nr:helix-turn-helix transcriptional regulator [Gordonibacter sp. KGMB12511]MDJ1650096.1 helix-turn-helix transcriptional regulator [Gordonibacter sp. KGMB12511]
MQPDTTFIPTSETRINIGRRIRMYRTRQGLSVRMLARMTGVDRTNIADIESGLQNAIVDTLTRLADGLGIELGLFFFDEDRIIPNDAN